MSQPSIYVWETHVICGQSIWHAYKSVQQTQDSASMLVDEAKDLEAQKTSTDACMAAQHTEQAMCPCSYPEMVPKILPFCGSARTSAHNKVTPTSTYPADILMPGQGVHIHLRA